MNLIKRIFPGFKLLSKMFMMGLISYGVEVFDNVQNDVGEGGLDSDYGSSEAFFFNPNYLQNMQFTQTDGFFKAGRLTAINDTPTMANLEVMVGSPKMIKESLITSYDYEIVMTFDHPTLLGLKLARASNFVQDRFYSTTGQTTVKTASVNTVLQTQVTAATGLAYGDFVEIDNTDLTYGGFPEIAQITGKIGTDIFTHTTTSQPAKPGKTFKKLAGTTTGTDDSDIGIQTFIGATKHPRIGCKIVHNLTNNQTQEVKGFYECINTTGTPKNFNDATQLATITITLKPVAKKKTTVDDFGRTQNSRVYGKEIVIPYESA